MTSHPHPDDVGQEAGARTAPDDRHEGEDHGHLHGHDAGDGHAHDAGEHSHSSGGIRGLLGGLLSPHSHDTADSIDSALTSSAAGLRALKISLAGLAATAAFQVVIVLISGSVALLGDTIHNFSDALTAVPLAIAFLVGRRQPTKRYTYGFGRSEDLAGIFIVAMIALSAALAGWEAVQRLMSPRPVDHVGWVMVAGMVGFAGNELVALYRIRVGRRIGSAALIADGLHARTDGLTSLAVVAGALGASAGWELADPLAGLAITVAILFVLKSAARDIYRRLMDSVEPGLVDDVHRVLASVPGVQAVESVRIRWLGHELRAEAEIISDADLGLADAHAIAEEAHHRLLHEIRRLAEATIHTSPCGHDGRDHHATTAHHFPTRAGTGATALKEQPATTAAPSGRQPDAGGGAMGRASNS